MADRIRVKICGLRDPEAVAVAVAAGADMLGVVLCPARRRVTLDEAARILGDAGKGALKVGVFVDPTIEEVQAAIETVGLDFVQLNGSESPEFCAAVGPTAIKSFKATPTGMHPDPSTYADGPIHLEAPGTTGGAGVPWDFSLASAIARQRPVMLSGGLDPDNVAVAIASVEPWAVDVSSGVETDGVKDHAKVRAFITNARQDRA
ncbi:MAG: phosphoribosylanthranilate isomerase [Chloroflexota bacterium]|jgi:phosphoribosylanthranilate isomerase|nr:phosphoribosylanthranilate isomerase [Chloroflexota bacterium]MDP6509529.1 phosphoribosylanthranilate isomerase [Chloroflexota bacterium]MDP6758147.1 phosphoribosylanthranilate isomerase [Chloroflexota bacterium]